MRITNAYSFSNEEINIITQALLKWANSFYNENGDLVLTKQEKAQYDKIMALYHNM